MRRCYCFIGLEERLIREAGFLETVCFRPVRKVILQSCYLAVGMAARLTALYMLALPCCNLFAAIFLLFFAGWHSEFGDNCDLGTTAMRACNPRPLPFFSQDRMNFSSKIFADDSDRPLRSFVKSDLKRCCVDYFIFQKLLSNTSIFQLIKFG